MARTSTSAAESAAAVELVPLARIVESPTNPRKTFAGLDELAESIRLHGVLQPVLLRHVEGIGSNMLQLVFGARRFRAAKAAGLEAIPAQIRELSDVDALEIQIVENSKREDVHPLEEAEGYEQLLHARDRKYSVEEIAAKVGRTPTYVYGRIKLLTLGKEAREAFYAEKLSLSGALALARIPDQGLQKKALKEIEVPRWEAERGQTQRPTHEVLDIIRERFMLRLADAPFSRDDAALVPAAGPCATCGKRTGAQPELFADVTDKKTDLCTDPPCFEKKKAAHAEQFVERAKAEGRKVLSATKAKELYPEHSSGLSYKADHVELSHENYDDPKGRTWKQLIGKVAKDAGAIVVAVDHRGEAHELVPLAETKKLLKEAGHTFKSRSTPTTTRQSKDEAAKVKASAALREATSTAVAERFVAFLESKGSADLEVLQLAAEQAWELAEFSPDRRLGVKDSRDHKKAVPAYLKSLSGGEVLALLVELSLERLVYDEPYGAEGKAARKRLLALAGIDPKKVETEVKAKLATQAGAEAAAKHLGMKSAPAKATKKKGGRRG